ncbi:RagB/SusD family nutrient uptake outer membrane protein [Alistipes sp. OttesenSCG-928-B03]|nr:RagB/SusD family nutrient uptake outer membrane protein [Alistipes sp. OttesenSCG-928-B03]
MKKIFIALMSVWLATSCSLDVTPENAITFQSYFRTEQDIESVMIQMVALVKNTQESWHFDYAGELFDFCRGYTAANETRSFLLSRLKYGADWEQYYNVIYLANVIIENVHRAEKNVPQDRIDFYTRQANFYKAYMYYNLSTKWGEAVVTPDSEIRKYAKSSMIDVIDEAIRCGLEAVKLPAHDALYSYTGNRFTSRQIGSKGSAASLLAYAYAWKGSIIDFYNIEGEDSEAAYREAVYWAGEVVEGRAGHYALENDPHNVVVKALYGNPLGVAVTDESIFEIETDKDHAIEYFCYSFIKAGTWWPFAPNSNQTNHSWNATVGLTANKLETMYTYNETVKDMRLPAYFADGSDKSLEEIEKDLPETWDWDVAKANSTEYGMVFPRKYRKPIIIKENENSTILKTWENNQVVFRLADVILLRAECNAKLGATGAATTDLNTIRTRAGAATYPSSNDGNDLQLAVFKEREKELVWERHRYFDIIRNGYHRTEFYGEWATLPDQDIQDGAYFRPVGSEAFSRNDLMRQNAFWLRQN